MNRTPVPVGADSLAVRQAQTAAARRESLRQMALRAASKEAVLTKAARIVRAGLELGLLDRADLDGPIVPEAGP